MTITILWWLLALVLVVTGLAGLVLPGLPGAPLVLVGLLVAAWTEDFAYAGWKTIAVLMFLTVLAYGADFLASALGAKQFGASNRAILGAAAGALVGLFFGLVGILLGPFLGAVLGELSIRWDLPAAGRAGLGAWLGLVVGAAAKFSIVFSMLGVFALARFL